MKKLTVLLLSGMLCFIATGCNLMPTNGVNEAEKEQAVELSKNLGDNIRSGKISINETEYTFPMEMEDFLTNGWEVSNSYKDKDEFKLEPGFSSSEFELFNEEGEYIRVAAINLSDEEQLLKDCMVSSLSVSFTEVNAVLPCGIYKSCKPADVEAAYGKEDERDDSESQSIDYKYEFVGKDEYRCTVKLHVVDNDYTLDPVYSVEYEMLDQATEDGEFLSKEVDGLSDREITQVYLDSVMKASYHGECDDYMKYFSATKEEAERCFDDCATYYAEAIMYYIGVDMDSVDEETKKEYVSFAKDVLKTTKWEFQLVTVSTTGSGSVNLNVWGTNLFDVVEKPLGEMLANTDKNNTSEVAENALKVMKDNMDKIETKEKKILLLDLEEGTLTNESWGKIDKALMGV